MTDNEIRQLIRSAIARHLGVAGMHEGEPAAPLAPLAPLAPMTPVALAFGRYTLPRAPDELMCLIEPTVRCNHCGYCESHGH